MTTNGDQNHNERVELRKAYSMLLEIKTTISKLTTISTLETVEIEALIHRLQETSIQIRGVPTTSRRSKLLQKISDEVLSLVNDYQTNPHSWFIPTTRRNDLLKLVDSGLTSIDNRLDELRRDITSSNSPLIDIRTGNHKFTLYGLISIIYIGGLTVISLLLDVSFVSNILVLILGIGCVLTFVDLFMVIWTRPYWLYSPSEDSLANKLLNSPKLWFLLPVLAASFCISLIFLGLELFILLSSSYSIDFITLFLSLIPIISSIVIVRYAQWRKKEYLICPHPICSNVVLPKPSSLRVHYETVHGIELDRAVREIRLKLDKSKIKTERKFRRSFGYLLLAISWFFFYELLFFLKLGNYYSFGILVIANTILISWALYELHIRLDSIPSDVSKKLRDDANKTAGNAAFAFIYTPMIVKYVVVSVLAIPLSLLFNPTLVLMISVATFMNSGFTQAITFPYLRKQFRTHITDSERWKKTLSNKRSAIWLLTIYLVYLVMAILAILGSYEYIEIFRFSYITSDLLIFAWAADIFSEVRSDILTRNA